ncbi:MAG: YeeE/YedE family protein [Betaproteobacteria bacterium]|nr:YeeE/YedE family protein [Betaproteobacteria bacterium]
MPENRSWSAGLREDYQRLLVEPWSPYLGVMVLVLLIALLMVRGTFWGVFGGLRLWGDWFNNAIGLGPLLNIKANLESPLLHRMSLMNIMLILGACSAALCSGQFGIFRAPKLEYLWGGLGGTLMGIGATLAGGCTTGGFFTPAMNSSPAGWVMAAGLMIGAITGLKLLMWTLDHFSWGTRSPPAVNLPLQRSFPFIGLLLAAAVGGWMFVWFRSDNEQITTRAILVGIGFCMGFVMHRSRLCFARAFREPFMTGEGEMTKAVILALAVGIPIAAIILQKKLADPYDVIPATFWLGSLVGGAIFGIGMVFAGGCASGALWRAGEGHIKLWLAVFFFAWGGSTFSGILSHWDVMARESGADNIEFTKVGIQVYLPDLLGGHAAAFSLGFGVLLIWYIWLRYNESTESFIVV